MSVSEINIPLFRIVLIEPEIPSNTGSIGRSCVGLNSELHLVGKLGFEINNRQLKRAGLDYWQYLKWFQHKSIDAWLEKVPDHRRMIFFSTKATQTYFEFEFAPGDWLVFGRETQGLSDEIRDRFKNQLVKMPMLGPIRSLNLSNAVTAAMYEGYRQINSRRFLQEK